jgi:branched-chain amino acid transport system permease protein
MSTAITCLVNGLTLSFMYILVASGFALMLNIMGIFNFAHGAIYGFGAYVTYGFSIELGLNRFVAIVVSAVVCGAIGFGLERVCFRPFTGSIEKTVIMTVALIFVLETTLNLIFGGQVRNLKPFVSGNLRLGFFGTSWARILTLACGVILLSVLTWLIRKTKVGRQMLAVSQDKVGAALQGININRTAGYATAIACGAAAIAGSLMGALLTLTPYMGDGPLTKAIEVVILSGFGSIGGVFAGGLIIGFLDAVVPVFTASAVAEVASLGVIMAILLVRPKGLFGYELF